MRCPISIYEWSAPCSMLSGVLVGLTKVASLICFTMVPHHRQTQILVVENHGRRAKIATRGKITSTTQVVSLVSTNMFSLRLRVC